MIVEQHVALAPRTTFGIGGPARRFVRVTKLDELTQALATEDRVLILGGGSNVLVPDAGWDGLVVEIGLPGVTIEMQHDHAIVSAAAGVVWDELVAQTIDAELAGLECMSGIPGLVGATPMQNVGAYGQEVSDTLVQVRAFDRSTQEIVTIARSECGFGYRSSKFKGSERWVILEAQFRLARSADSAPIRYPELARALGVAEGHRAPLEEVRRTVIQLRRGKGMVIDAADPESRSAGSFFVNPILDAAAVAELDARLPPGVAMPRFPQSDGRVKLSAGWLIERAGFSKGYTRGHAGISRKHALALVNRGGATATEILALAREIVDGVRDKLGVTLVPEVRILSAARE